MKRISLILMIASLFVLQSFAQPGPGKGRFNDCPKKEMKGEHPGMGMHFNMIDRLNLTEDQAQKFNKLKFEEEKELLPLRSETSKVRDELALLEVEDNPNMKAIYGKIDELTALKAKTMKLRAKYKMELRKILTDEQRIRWDQNQLKGPRGKGRCF